MNVYLVRHARAVSEGPKLADEQRFLDAEGRRTARAVGDKLRAEGVSFDAVLTSPLVRAVQTAELLATATGYDGVVESFFALAPGLPPRVVAEELAAHGESVCVVGHEPTISALGAFLTSSPSFPPFRPGQVALIERGVPKWMLRPDLIEFEPLRLG